MSDFENFLCFSSVMARCDRTGSAEVQERRLRRTAPSQRKNKGNFQNRSYHLIIDERNEKTDLNLSDFTFREQS